MMKPEASTGSPRRLPAPSSCEEHPEALEIAICGQLLVEQHARADRLELRLFGRLDPDAARAVESHLLTDSPAIVFLDLTHLEATEPAALRGLIDRQREDHQRGRQLLLRIAPRQITQLSVADPGDSQLD